MTTILLAEDHMVVREGLRALLDGEPGMTVVGEAADGIEAVAAAERLAPDVVVLDLMMPGLSGLDALVEIGRRCPRSGVVVLTMHGEDAYVFRALRDGALGYVLKDSSGQDLIAAVREAAAGRRYLPVAVARHLADALARGVAGLEARDLLTARERQVVHLAGEGRTNAEIAERLSISRRTVESYKASAMRKLGLKTNRDLIRYALETGLLPPRG